MTPSREERWGVLWGSRRSSSSRLHAAWSCSARAACSSAGATTTSVRSATGPPVPGLRRPELVPPGTGGPSTGRRGTPAPSAWTSALVLGRQRCGAAGRRHAAGISTPTRVGTESDWRSISAGDGHTCGRRGAGTLWCWGGNDEGQLGDDSTDEQLAPTQIGSANDWKAVERRVRAHLRRAGSRHLVVLGQELGPASSAWMTAGAARCRRASATRATGERSPPVQSTRAACVVRGPCGVGARTKRGSSATTASRDPLRAHPDREPHRLAGGRWSRHPHVRSAGSGDVVVLGGQQCGAARRRRHRDRSEPTQVGSQTDWVAASRGRHPHLRGALGRHHVVLGRQHRSASSVTARPPIAAPRPA